MKLRSKSSISGMSLLEVVLVIGIASTIVLLANAQYQSFRRDADAQQALYIVNQLFQAGSEYYQANCKRQWDPATGPISSTGTLDPANSPYNPYAVSTESLTTAGFMTAKLVRNPIINTDDGDNPGYVVQFNQVTPPADRKMVINSSGDTKNLGQIIMWRVQVSILLNNPETVVQYKNMLGADCLSTLADDESSSASYVTPCSLVGTPPVNGPDQKVYAVWERLPSYAVPVANSGLWSSMPEVRRFNQLFEVNPMIYLGSVPDADYPKQNYLCGS